jgi:vanillate/3-O-methylgallate O-demethylase
MLPLPDPGPNAEKVIEKLNGGPFRTSSSFTWTDQDRRALGRAYGMAWPAPQGSSLGPTGTRGNSRCDRRAGRDFGLRQVGARAYATNTLESGWIPSPLPAVYTGAAMKPYRQWLPATSYEASGSMGGSFYSDNIEDYYLTPYELGYGPFVKFDHDFIGRSALEKIAGQPHRRKVTFAWNADDVIKVFTSMFQPGADHYKYIDLPLSNYTSASYDRIMHDGKMVGLSMFSGYSYNERSMLSLGTIDPDIKTGSEVVLVWGEEGGGSRKSTVERHKQTQLRAVVSPVPTPRWRAKPTPRAGGRAMSESAASLRQTRHAGRERP